MSENISELVGQLNTAFEAFKAEHTKQLEEAKKGIHDALQALKVDKINADISRLQAELDDTNIKLAAVEMGGQGQKVKDREYSDAFRAFFKKGEVQAALNKGADD